MFTGAARSQLQSCQTTAALEWLLRSSAQHLGWEIQSFPQYPIPNDAVSQTKACVGQAGTGLCSPAATTATSCSAQQDPGLFLQLQPFLFSPSRISAPKVQSFLLLAREGEGLLALGPC